MDFVGKKDFEAAMDVIDRALKNGQIIDGRDSSITLNGFLFSVCSLSYVHDYTVAPNCVDFIASDLAAKNSIFALRNKLKTLRENADKNRKDLEKLEAEEQRLVALLPTLKE